jgi:hypothetical protein
VLNASRGNVFSELPSLGQFNVAEVGNYSFYISSVSAEYCAMLCVACLTAGQRAKLICVDCERKSLKRHPLEIQ